MTDYIVCVDTGSTFTKATAVAVAGASAGSLLGTASVPTTVGAGMDVLTGLDDAVAAVAASIGTQPVEVRACSSAGGGLRLAVVGYERVITAEAAARVGLSAGAKIVHVASGALDDASIAALVETRPDIVLLAGGTDGGNSDVIRHNGAVLAVRGPRVPIVVAGNADSTLELTSMLEAHGHVVMAAANVLPRIGVIEETSARTAIRAAFVSHVIGGKGISAGPRFASLVRGATPDLVLAGMEVMADALGHDVLMVDVGGATTDVYSVLTEAHDAQREPVEMLWHGRTVEGDLGMRWSAPDTLIAAEVERLDVSAGLAATVDRRHNDPAWLPPTDDDRGADAELARLAFTIALRRHSRSGRDLGTVRTAIASGGALRHAGLSHLASIVAPLTDDTAGGWRLPASAHAVLDRDYVMAAVGLLADLPHIATRLARHVLAAD